ncbi:anti-sigma factor [Nakamurella sp.]|uniref:anti-sigma factor n=1 Tax=Nakamurella sp. TaxID=1869182 RepID=UPI003783F6FA
MPHLDGPLPDPSQPDSHPDPDDLALVALDEQLGAGVDEHIAGCATCTEQVESFRGTIELAGLSDYGRDAPPPGDHVWAAISTDLGFAGSTPVAGPPAVPPALPRLVSVPGPAEPAAEPTPSIEPTARPARRNRWIAPIAAAAVGIALGAGAVIVVQNREGSVTVDATAPLTPVQGGPLPTSDGQVGTAELVTARNGQQVRVDASALPAPTSTAYEVWLFGDDGRMVSLGTLADGSGSFTVPAGIDTTQYRTVDVSDEPPDGNPAHSGISLIRGTFA